MLIFDFPGPDGRPQRQVFDEPVEVLVAHDLADVRPLLRAVEAAAARGLHAAGFVTYDAGPAFEPALVTGSRQTLPLAWFGLYQPSRAPRAGSPSDESLSFQAGLKTRLYDPATTTPQLAWQPAIPRDAYDAAVAAIRRGIGDGDVYQVNYTFPLHAPFDAGEPAARALYERIAADAHGRYGAYLDIGTHRLLSFSPELFFERRGAHLTCRPMKGTASRGRWPQEDGARAETLRESVKDRAENVMIVDLVRNDLGRLAVPGSVRVPDLCTLERYPTVWQMTSTIEADVPEDTTLDSIFAALFPCGSVTGAPKISAMQTIARLEPTPRGLYCGAIGMVSPARTVFNVAIRTMTIDVRAATAAYHVGGGVTWDSTAGDEYAEALAKAALLTPAPDFALLETLRLEDGRLVRLERHLARLIASARYFDIPLDESHVRARLATGTDRHATGRWRLRLRVARDGDVQLDVTDMPADTGLQRVALAATPIDDRDRLLFHKTSARAIYEARRAERPGLFDVLLWNPRGELTEFTIGNLVVQIDGRLWTPPQASGLLAGAFRAQLLDENTIHERILTRDDLVHADAMWLINSLREWVRVDYAR